MKEINNIAGGKFKPPISTVNGLLAPFLGAGTWTATQSGTTIAVTGSVAHNIPSSAAARISNRGVGCLLQFATNTSNLVTGWFNNLVVTSTTSFTVQSAISQTVSTAVSLVSLVGLQTAFTPMAIAIPPNTMGAGSVVNTKVFLQTLGGSVVTSRNTGVFLGIGTNVNGITGYSCFFNSGFYTITDSNYAMVSEVSFLNNLADSDFVTMGGISGYTKNTQLTLYASPLLYIKPSDGFNVVLNINTTIAQNDWVFLISMYADVTV